MLEDEHLLVVNKPAGWNTHAPAPFAGEGLYEWLKNRHPRWSGLSILHRLDKETSGLMVFGKTADANRSLARQFEERRVQKKYILLTDRKPSFRELRASSALARCGAKYVSRPPQTGAPLAETGFVAAGAYIEAVPLTGRTHQIRVHAAENGFPILGDVLCGGAPAARLCLHSAELRFEHPVTSSYFAFPLRRILRAMPGWRCARPSSILRSRTPAALCMGRRMAGRASISTAWAKIFWRSQPPR